MSDRVTRQVVEELYDDALMLADEARQVFDMRNHEPSGAAFDEGRIALSIEGMRTTTRLMNLLAWLLNQRAFLAGEITSTQLRLGGELLPDRPSDPVQMARIPPATRALVRESERLFARAERLDRQMRSTDTLGPARQLQGKLSSAFSAG